MQHRRDKASVVDQHVDPSMGLHHQVEHCRDCVTVGHVGWSCHCGPTCVHDACRYYLSRVGIDIVHDDGGPDRTEALGDRLTDACLLR